MNIPDHVFRVAAGRASEAIVPRFRGNALSRQCHQSLRFVLIDNNALARGKSDLLFGRQSFSYDDERRHRLQIQSRL